MSKREYFSVRNNLSKPYDIGLEPLKTLFLNIYNKFREKDYFYEHFGSWCVDSGDIEGTLGDQDTINAKLFLELGKEDLWPIKQNLEKYKEDDLFDIMEFLFDHISVPSEGYYHEWNECGWHDHKKFDRITAQEEYRESLNNLLSRYKEKYTLTKEGVIVLTIEPAFERLFEAQIPSERKEEVTDRIIRAKEKFLSRNPDEKRAALKELADVFEFLRPQAKEKLKKQDENDLFNILNNFGIRHHNQLQKTDYNKSIFYRWLFYYYLAAIHATLRLIAD